MVKITLINGDAGTGKTYKLTKYINNVIDKNKTFICLAFTHSAVNNIYNMFKINFPEKDINKDMFQTLHKFFHIDPKTGNITNYSFKKYDYMFIDEYSLISVNMLETIKETINKNIERLILCGDFKQLRTIETKNEISYDKLLKYSKVFEKNNFNKEILKAIQHFDNSILSTEFINKNITNIVILKDYIRNENHILRIINNLCFNEIDKDYIKSLFCKKSTLINLMKNNNYVFIASTYESLQKVNDFLANNDEETITIKQKDISTEYGLNKINLKENQDVIITENLKYGDDVLTNGDILIFKDYSESTNMITLYDYENNKYFIIPPQVVPLDKSLKVPKDFEPRTLGKFKYKDNFYYSYFPILPSNLITYHKAQGKTINNVILCVDNLFEFSMLYTGLTRAKNNVLLFTFNEQYKDIENVDNIYKYLNILVYEFLYKNHKVLSNE